MGRKNRLQFREGELVADQTHHAWRCDAGHASLKFTYFTNLNIDPDFPMDESKLLSHEVLSRFEQPTVVIDLRALLL
jgi:hypothetical protein